MIYLVYCSELEEYKLLDTVANRESMWKPGTREFFIKNHKELLTMKNESWHCNTQDWLRNYVGMGTRTVEPLQQIRKRKQV